MIGLGVGEQHARAIAAHSRARVAWLLDLDRGRAEALARTLGQGDIASDYAAVLADPAVDAVMLASYDDDHAAQVVAALQAGKHVFCEKPLCRTLAEAAAIGRARGDRHLRCNLVLRAAPLFRWLRDAIRNGELGDVYALDGDYLYGRLHKITDGWRGEVDDYSVIQG
ncbi:MAG TPA: Gfo/Idh/MocA family oxidoreductase, partial [Kofleriaceae bacterium]